ncbi:MAG: LytTR family transcriptional regulator [Hyphomonadaceae bacterium]|nr:LytTR family transcriptional regulator [Hyphomonadaceae bacterium]
MTTGDTKGTSGLPRGEWRPWILVALVAVVIVAVNASSDYLEMTRSNLDFQWWEPWLWEVTSAIVIVALAPLIGKAVRRWTPARDHLIRPALIHFGLTIPFAAVHIIAIWVMRESFYWAAHEHYGFFDDGVALVSFYEWRKDVLTYATIAAVYWIFQYIAQRKAAATVTTADERIEVRDGGAAVFLAPADITHVEAAGNYVEFHTPLKTHLVRGTLASWETRLLARGFIRVHRSRLVNRSKITALKPTPSGDLEITLSDGHTVLGSRRYRAVLA